MKTTVEINDALLDRARLRASETGQPLRAVIEDALRQLLAKPLPKTRYKMEDGRYGNPEDPDPTRNLTWEQIRDIIYEGR